MLKMAVGLAMDDGDAARAGEFSLKDGRGHLAAQIAINTLIRDKIFTNAFGLSDAFFETGL